MEKQAQRNGLERPQRVGGRTRAGILTPPACRLLDTLISLVELSTVPGHQGLSLPWVGVSDVPTSSCPLSLLGCFIADSGVGELGKEEGQVQDHEFLDFMKANKGVGEGFVGLLLTVLLEVSQVILIKTLQNRY